MADLLEQKKATDQKLGIALGDLDKTNKLVTVRRAELKSLEAHKKSLEVDKAKAGDELIRSKEKLSNVNDEIKNSGHLLKDEKRKLNAVLKDAINTEKDLISHKDEIKRGKDTLNNAVSNVGVEQNRLRDWENVLVARESDVSFGEKANKKNKDFIKNGLDDLNAKDSRLGQVKIVQDRAAKELVDDIHKLKTREVEFDSRRRVVESDQKKADRILKFKEDAISGSQRELDKKRAELDGLIFSYEKKIHGADAIYLSNEREKKEIYRDRQRLELDQLRFQKLLRDKRLDQDLKKIKKEMAV